MQRVGILALVVFLMGASFKDVKKDADEALRRGDYKIAISQYETFLKQQNPGKQDKFNTYLELADIYLYRLKKPRKAIEYLLKAKQLFPETYRRMDEVYYRLGLAYEKIGDYQKAAEMYEKLVMNFQKSKYYKDAWNRINVAFAHNYQDTVAYVGGEYITSMQVENLLERLNPMMRSYYSTEEGKKKLLEEMIKQKLLVKEAEARKLYLKSDVQDRLQQCYENVLARAMVDEIRNSVKVTDKEAEKFYREHLEEYKEPATIKAYRIVVHRRTLADSLYRLLRKGANFDSLRVKFSEARDKSSKSPIVITKKGKKDKFFEQIFKTRKGKFSKPIQENDSTFVIFKVIEKKKEGYRPFKNVKAAIKMRLKQKKQKEAYDRLIEELKKKYNVRIMWNESKKSEKKTKEKDTKK